mgnify:CR=1 FL=1
MKHSADKHSKHSVEEAHMHHDVRKKRTKYSDDFIDGVALVCVIAIIVTSISYWLYNA